MDQIDRHESSDEHYDVADFESFAGEGAFGSDRPPCCELDEDGLDSDLYEED